MNNSAVEAAKTIIRCLNEGTPADAEKFLEAVVNLQDGGVEGAQEALDMIRTRPVDAAETLAYLMREGTTDTVRLAAAEFILDVAGIRQPRKVEVTFNFTVKGES